MLAWPGEIEYVSPGNVSSRELGNVNPGIHGILAWPGEMEYVSPGGVNSW